MTRRLCTAALLLTLGCGSPLDVEEERLPLLRTDADQYAVVVGPGVATLEVPYRFTNHTSVTIYVGGCRSVIVPIFDRRVDGEWVELVGPGALDCGATPVAIPPGATLDRTALARWLVIDDLSNPQAYRPGSIAGELRLRWWQAATEPFSIGPHDPASSLPLALSVSNAFQVTEPGEPSSR